ncbi:MAG: hypothetical protein JJD92_00070 [Frankiaceae bacterium]|nr:hypothetical protein [Frankiaceae bacterium]
MTPLLADLPHIEAFPTVDEVLAFADRLAAEHPERVSVRDVGRSRAGDRIQLLTVAAASPRGSVLVVGQPHPNEPIGMATVMTLARRLAERPDAVDELGVDWHFVPCADPDATRLNEGWFAGPWTREHYARNFFRPQGSAQVEWTFPFRHGDFEVDAPMPETEALMAAIDIARPQVLTSLHNAELGGAYFYATPGSPGLYPRLTALCDEQGIPLHLGDPETPFSVELHPAVFTVPTATQMYEMAMSIGMDPAVLVSGASSLAYAEQYGPVAGVVVELPYWRDERAADTTADPSGVTRRDATLAALDLQEQAHTRLRELLETAGELPPSPFRDAVEQFTAMFEGAYIEGQREEARSSAEYDRPATVADTFSLRDNLHMSRLRLGGMLLRAIPPGAPARDEAERVFDGWCGEAAADDKASVIPIRDLVAVQAGSVLAAVEETVS